MFDSTARRRWLYLAAGLVLGLVWSGLWPDSPAHAVATAQLESFAVCTAPLDDDGEAIFFLDYLTGDIKGAAINPNNGKFMAFFQANVTTDLGVDVAKGPKYLLVNGVNNFKRVAGGPQFGNSIIYVAELTSGKVVAYGVPWQRQNRNSTAPFRASMVLLDSFPFRNVAVRNPWADVDITFNGEPRRVAEGTTVAALLAELRLTPAYVAVEIDLELVPRGQHAGRVLSAGDRVEVVTLVGGG